MTYQAEIMADAPVVYWKLDETSGTDAADSSGGNFHGTHSGVSVGQPSLLADGSGKSAHYNGTTSFTREAWSPTWGDIAHPTVTVRYKPDAAALSGTKPIASAWIDPFRWILWLNGGKVEGYIYTSSGNSNVIGTTTLLAGNTYTIALRYSGTTLDVLVNGVVDGAKAETRPISTAPFVALELGRVSQATYGSGTIDEFALFGSALSNARLLAHHNAAVDAAGAPISGSLAATLPSLAASLSGVYVPPTVTGSLAATLPALAANLSGAYDGPIPAVAGDLAATLPPLSTSLAGTYTAPLVVVETSTRYANDGYNYDGTAAVEFEPPIAEPPAHIRRAKVQQVHQSMSAPNLVNGVPR